jgi:hypothetical protein
MLKIFLSLKRGVLDCISSGGKISSMRVMSFLTLFTILGTFIGKNITGHGFVDLGQYAFLVILTLLGAKVGQSFAESAKDVRLKEIGIENDPTGKP